MPKKPAVPRVFNRYTPPPETEIKLAALQELYVTKDCPLPIKHRYFNIMKVYARSLLLKEMKRKGIILPPERVEELTVDSTLLLLNQYRKEGWKVSASFAGALRWKVVEALYGDSKEEMNYSLNRVFSDDSNAKEALDLVRTSDSPWYKGVKDDPADEVIDSTNAAVEEIDNLIEQAYDILPYHIYMKFLTWLLLRIRKPRTKNIMNSYHKLFLNNKEEEAFDILLLEMRNRILMHARG